MGLGSQQVSSLKMSNFIEPIHKTLHQIPDYSKAIVNAPTSTSSKDSSVFFGIIHSGSSSSTTVSVEYTNAVKEMQGRDVAILKTQLGQNHEVGMKQIEVGFCI